ncbi:unnamed protein product [Bursaphelenchus okinawaensis]|uniref:Uncharacterized protein n=1 Tax=Bursaphelenchus okinawaensis TaxID=465554 RepID=A0A811KFC5_9BILA|nr:unnamed protein product [Bursaphelenchus okinawaensis]CAG9102062.1 unnamed protein product [Bursaphelenchus okinawaensis]
MSQLAPITLAILLPIIFSATVPPQLRSDEDKDDGNVWCPAPVVGQKCPSGSIFHYYYCCGTASKDCCSGLETWFVVVLVFLGLLVLSAIVVGLMRFIKGRR